MVVFSGTLVSGTFENTGAFSAWCGVTGGRTVMARLLPGWAVGLIGLTYWYTTYRIACWSGEYWSSNHSSAT